MLCQQTKTFLTLDSLFLIAFFENKTKNFYWAATILFQYPIFFGRYVKKIEKH